MAPTILVTFSGFIVHSKPNVAPKLTDQSHSNPIYRALLHISLASIFFYLPLKLRAVYKRKNLKFIFSQKRLQRNSSNFVGLQYIRNPIT